MNPQDQAVGIETLRAVLTHHRKDCVNKHEDCFEAQLVDLQALIRQAQIEARRETIRAIADEQDRLTGVQEGDSTVMVARYDMEKALELAVEKLELKNRGGA